MKRRLLTGFATVAGMTAFLLVIGTSSAAAFVSGEASGTAINSAASGSLPGNNAALSSWGFHYNKQSHHIKEISAALDPPRLLPGGNPNTWWAQFKDTKNKTFDWYLRWTQLPTGTKFGGYWNTTNSGGFPEWLVLGRATPNTVPVLTGFSVINDPHGSSDMHLAHLRVQLLLPGHQDYDPNYVKCIVLFADDSPSNESVKQYAVSYAEVPAERVRTTDKVWGTAQTTASGPLNAAQPVLTGFGIDKFPGGDTHIDQIGVSVRPGSWGATFQNGSQFFDYLIEYADLQD